MEQKLIIKGEDDCYIELNHKDEHGNFVVISIEQDNEILGSIVIHIDSLKLAVNKLCLN